VIQTPCHRWSASLLLSLCALLFSVAPQQLLSQAPSTTLTGTITDAKGGVLQSATVSVKNESTVLFALSRLTLRVISLLADSGLDAIALKLRPLASE
jgi:hypothetical protein